MPCLGGDCGVCEAIGGESGCTGIYGFAENPSAFKGAPS